MLASTSSPTLPGAWFDAASADAACAWIERYCRHTEGQWFNKPFNLADWQRQIVRDLFGWKTKDGWRVYREAWIEIPRKNGKSEFAAAIALLLLVADGEPGGQVYSVAGDESQARIVWHKASVMVGLDPTLSGAVESFKTSLYVPNIMATYRPLSGSRSNKHGLSAHGVIGDEVHEWKNRDAYDAVRTSTAARSQPLEIYITTAGVFGLGLAWQMHDYALKVAGGIIENASLYVAIFGADLGDDWTDPEVWAKANPNLGISPTLDYFKAEFEKARASVAYENVFRRLHLNQWTESTTKWLDLASWDKGAAQIPLERLRGKKCWAGLDLARVNDLSALALCFPPSETGLDRWAVLMRYWLPADNMAARVDRDRVPYDQWVRAGHIDTTPGNTTDYAFLEADILELASLYSIQELAFDRTFAGELVINLMAEGVPMVEHGQGFISMAAPTAELERLVLAGQIQHGGNPVLRWNAVNTVVRQDPAGNLKPDKEKSIERIDGIVAAIMAVGRASARAKPREILTDAFVA
jgi:phage terminase large subunit-like protein